MTLAFYASDRYSKPSLATIFYLFIFLAFVVFILIFFFFFIFNRIDNPPTSAFRYKSQKAVNSLYFLHKYRLFLSSKSSCLHNRSIFLTPRMRFLCSKFFYRVYIKFRIFCFLTCPKLLHLSHTKTNC